MTRIIPWLLTGALAASTGLNIYHAKGDTTQAPDSGCESKGCGMAVVTAVRSSTGDQPCCPSPSELSLTAEQKKRFEQCCPTSLRTCEQLETDLDELLASLEKELNAVNPDQTRAYQLADQIGKVRTGELKSRIRTVLEVRRTLTPEQLLRLISATKGD